MTLEDCQKKLAEIEEMARIVSFGPDRRRLAEQADTWRARCEAMEAEAGRPTPH